MCHSEPEDDFHVLITCTFARSVWGLSVISSNFGFHDSLISWWNNLASISSINNLEITSVVLWSIWQNRNEEVWTGTSKPAIFVYHTALDLYSNWHDANVPPLNTISIPRQQGSVSWQPPQELFVKCNVDASIFSSLNKAGYGCIIRNHIGAVVAAIHGNLPGISNTSLAEAMGIRDALSWINDLHISNVIFESDALLIVEVLNSKTPDFSTTGPVSEDCKILSLDIQSVFLCLLVDQRIKRLMR